MKTILLIVTLLAIAGAIFYLESKKPARIVPPPAPPADLPVSTVEKPTSTATNAPAPAAALKTNTTSVSAKSGKFQRAPDIQNPGFGFINTDKVSLKDLLGKQVVLVDFWTYSCINCQRTIPYLNQWYDKYRDQGLVIIGVHTPEFEFEKEYANVAAAVKKFGIQYPVVLDNDYATWTAYRNQYWPHKYLVDIDGFIRYDHIGEGFYAETEKKIQELLGEHAQALGMTETIAKDISRPTPAAEVNFARVASPETYFGARRNSLLGNGRSGAVGPQTLAAPAEIKPNALYLVGDWELNNEYAENKNAGAKILYRYSAKNVYLVAGADRPVAITVLRDGQPVTLRPEENLIGAHRLYTIVGDQSDYGAHTLEIIIEQPGLRAYAFTFG